MWAALRALAARIGLSQEEILRVERGGEPTLVQDPLTPKLFYKVREDPDWPQRLKEAWSGSLVNSRQELVGTITASDGRIFLADAYTPNQRVVADVVPGEYAVVVTVAHQGDDATFDYEENTSHLAMFLQSNRKVSRIEPLTGKNRDELGLVGYLFMLSGRDILGEIVGDHAGQWALRSADLMHPSLEVGTNAKLYGTKLDVEGTGEAIFFYGGRGRGDYPLYRIADSHGETIGIMIDFFIDNRPWPEEPND